MKVELLYFDGCPNWHDAESNLRAAAERAGVEVEVTFTEITTPEEAGTATVPRITDDPDQRSRPLRGR